MADPADRIAAALERIALSLELLVAEQHPGPRRAKAPKKPAKRARIHRPAGLVEVDELSRKRAEAALRRYGL